MIGLKNLFGISRRQKGPAAAEKAEELTFEAGRHFLLPRDLVMQFLDAADDDLEQRLEETGKPSETDELFSDYLDLVREDPDWPIYGYAFRLPDGEGDTVAQENWSPCLEGKASPKAALAAKEFLKLQHCGLASWDETEKSLTIADFVISRYFPSSLLPSAGLPAGSDISLKLYSEGVDFTTSFQMKMDWIQYGHLRMSPKRTGLIFKSGTTENSLLGPIFFVADALERFSDRSYAGPVEKTAAWAGVSGLIRNSPYKKVVDSEGGSARLVNATKLTLEIDEKGNVVPVFIRTKKSRNDGKGCTPLLTAAQMRALKKYFNSSLPVTDYIDLGYQSYVSLSPQVKKVFAAVRNLSRGNADEKVQLIAEPAKAIARELARTEGEDAAAVLDAVSGIFVETPDFLSQRIRAIGEWRPHSISIVQPVPTSWFSDGSDRYRVMVAGRWHLWTQEEIAEFVREFNRARSAGNGSFLFDGNEFELASIDIGPIKALLRQILEGEDSQSPEDTEKDKAEKGKDAEPQEEKRRFGPLIKSNLTALEYVAEEHKHPDFVKEFAGLSGGMQLYPHQVECLHWLQDLWKRGVSGALLADDMGLGKTLQCLSFLKWLSDNYESLNSPRTALIIAPVGLIKNWEAEGQKYFGNSLGKPLVLFADSSRDLSRLPEQERLAKIARHKWVIANYESIKNYFPVFSNVDWSLIALDEAQRIKTPNTILTEFVRGLQSEFLLAMTGTPVENSFLDLWSIMDTAIPGLMGSAKDFMTQYGKPEDLETAGRELHALLTGKDGASDQIRLMLRRLKKDRLKGLPEKREKKCVKLMPPKQEQLYEEILADKNTRKVSGNGNSAAFNILKRLENCSLFGVEDYPAHFGFSEEEIAGSARLSAFFEILDSIHQKKEKVLVFTTRRLFQDKLADAIEKRYGMRGHPPALINGSMNIALREKAVENFQKAPPGRFDVMILSAKAAGVGLTLTNANNVVHLERWWNPAVEDQCTDRAYRIGQDKDVTVYLPIAKSSKRNTFDVILDGLLSRKRAQSSAVLAPGDDQMTTNGLVAEVLKS